MILLMSFIAIIVSATLSYLVVSHDGRNLHYCHPNCSFILHELPYVLLQPLLLFRLAMMSLLEI